MSKILKISMLFMSFSIVVLPFFVLAQGNHPQGSSGEIDNPLGTTSFTIILTRIINWAAGIVGFVAVLMVLIGGFQYMISGGNEEKIQRARKTIQYALIGLLIIGLSWSFVNVVLTILNA